MSHEVLGDAIEFACEKLPPGWEITIMLEQGCGLATLTPPNDVRHVPHAAIEGETLATTIRNAVEYAIETEKND